MVGSTLSHYKILDELGRGGMGIVYRAEDTKLHRTVAIKVLPAAALSNEDDRARFYREARAAASLTHPHIAVVHEIDEAIPSDAPHGTDPSPFIAMEFIEGETLDERIKSGPLKLEEAVRIASEVAAALEAAHEKNVVHRDIKSANVMLTAKGEAKVLDFGLAQTAQSTKLTKMGSTVGTIGYMSPEQARGEEVDKRTDIWSLGVVLYEMISGRHPFPGEYEQAVVYEILNAEPEPLTAIRTGVPMALEWMVTKMLAKAPGERYQSTAEIQVDLKTVDLRSPSGMSRVSTAAVAATPGIGTRRARKISLPVVATMLVAVAATSALIAITMRPITPPKRVMHANVLVDQHNLGYPALSPDGRFLAYRGSTRRGETPSLFVRDFSTGETLSIPNSDGAVSISFSPDGSKIAFKSGGRLYTVSATGGEPLLWTDGIEYDPVWGPDDEIYFTRSGQMMRIDGPGEIPAPFLAPDTTTGQRNFGPYQVLADAKQLLAFDERLGGVDRLISIDLESRDVDSVMSSGAFMVKYAPTGHLVYVTNYFEQIFARPWDPKTFTFLGPIANVHSTVYYANWTFSESGHFVAVNEVESSDLRLAVVNSAQDVRSLSADVGEFYHLRVSPNLRYFAVDNYDREEEESGIDIWDVETNSFRTLVQPRGSYNWGAAWSPDGKQIVFTGPSALTIFSSLYVQEVDGAAAPVALTKPAESRTWWPDWSPLGDEIVFSDGQDLLIYSFSEGRAHPLSGQVNTDGTQTFPRFSPVQGRFIAYVSYETKRAEIFVATKEGNRKWQVTTEGGQGPVWSRDGSRLYYRKDFAIHAVDVEFDPVFSWIPDPEPVYDSETLQWFDSLGETDSFAISEWTEIAPRYFEVIFNWFEELERLAPHDK